MLCLTAYGRGYYKCERKLDHAGWHVGTQLESIVALVWDKPNVPWPGIPTYVNWPPGKDSLLFAYGEVDRNAR